MHCPRTAWRGWLPQDSIEEAGKGSGRTSPEMLPGRHRPHSQGLGGNIPRQGFLLSQSQKRLVPGPVGDVGSAPRTPGPPAPSPCLLPMENLLSLTFHELFFPLLHKQAKFPTPLSRLARAARAQLAPIRGSPALRVAKNKNKAANPDVLHHVNRAAAFQDGKREGAAGVWEAFLANSLHLPEEGCRFPNILQGAGFLP